MLCSINDRLGGGEGADFEPLDFDALQCDLMDMLKLKAREYEENMRALRREASRNAHSR